MYAKKELYANNRTLHGPAAYVCTCTYACASTDVHLASAHLEPLVVPWKRGRGFNCQEQNVFCYHK